MTQRLRTVTWQDPLAATPAEFRSMSGLDFLSAIVRGDVPQPPIAESLDFRLAEVREGEAVFVSEPQEFHYNPIGTVHGGYYGTILDSAMSCAVHATLAPGERYTTLEYKVNIVRGLSAEDGTVRGEGRVVHRGRRIATSEGRIVDANWQDIRARHGNVSGHRGGRLKLFAAHSATLCSPVLGTVQRDVCATIARAACCVCPGESRFHAQSCDHYRRPFRGQSRLRADDLSLGDL